ncbi:MAG: hypothetical protein CMC13_01085 [Flavobacteriaceae bacterium]|nr:hypothetical protein [Flavobacteriaceae bacterium]|tara:strand:+ start:720 stop:1457 length:738 start_codon:yes stop_codon:yes gene_type:complete
MTPRENEHMQFLDASERYLGNRMDLAEKAAFEEKLAEDPILSQQFDEHKKLILGIESAVLKENLDEYHATVENDSGVKTLSDKKTSPYLWLGIAASIVVVLGLFLFFDKNDDNDALFATHFVPDPGLPTTMGTSENYTFYEGMVDYKREDYKTAITKWESLYAEKPENDTLNYFLGVAELANKNAANAITYLEKVAPVNESMFQEEIFHYLGLANLKAGNMEQAKQNFQKSKKPESAIILSELNN